MTIMSFWQLMHTWTHDIHHVSLIFLPYVMSYHKANVVITETGGHIVFMIAFI